MTANVSIEAFKVTMATEEYNSSVEELREREYPMLKDSVYLDHAGTTLYSKSLMDRFTADMMSSLLGNPHSGSGPSQRTTSRIEDIRLRLLHFLRADPAEFDLVFVANATAGVKLVTDAFRAMPSGFRYAYHEACHTSLVGVREESRESLCVDDEAVDRWLAGEGPFENSVSSGGPVLFSYPAQSHMNGQRYPLSWSRDLRGLSGSPSTLPELYTLLDAASLVATSPLDLSDAESAPDFTVMSLYKIFGFPDIGALIVRRQAEHAFHFRKYFGGGTVDTVISGKEQWHASKTQFLHEKLEDGTLPFHNLLALDAAMDTHQELFGSMASIAAHTSFLSRRLCKGLASLRHENQQAVCVLYTKHDPGSSSPGCGPVVAFNIRNAAGAWVSLNEFEKLATLKNFHVRTGGVCSPGGIAAALHLQPWEIRRNFSSGFKCGTDQDIIAGKPTGVIRASLGAMSTKDDVDKFIAFIDEFYREEEPLVHTPTPAQTLAFQVESITVYPIKSCAGFAIPPDTPWEVRPEGLAWDREWCLVHQGTGQALSQKRHPRMALLRPSLDFARGVLGVTYAGTIPHPSITIPLSAPPSTFKARPALPSRVCGDQINALTYASPAINDFFSTSLGVPCLLARFPAGGHGPSMRHSKPHTLKHLKPARPSTLPGSFPGPPSPPDSDSEQHQESRILLANESPILLVSTPSLDALNRDVTAAGGEPVSMAAFRGNIVVGPAPGSPPVDLAYAEDSWTGLQIGHQSFKLMGSCRRCQMVCIDQTSGEKRQEPFVTLAKTRRFDGKVYFGMHMRHDAEESTLRTRHSQFPTISIGDMAHPCGPRTGDE